MKNIILILLVLVGTKVQASNSTDSLYDEVSYSDLVDQLNQQNRTALPSPVATQDIYIFGVGYATSFSSFLLESKSNQKTLGGVKANFGFNVFVPDVFVELTYAKYIDQRSIESNLGVQDMALEMNFLNEYKNSTSFRLGAGLGMRLVNYSSQAEQINSSSPNFSLHAGVFNKIHRNLQAGLDIGGRAAFQGKSEDKGSLDLSFRLESVF